MNKYGAKGLKGKTLLAYTAGIIDGEGCISLSRRMDPAYKQGYQLRLTVCVANTNEWLVQWLKIQFGGSISCNTDKRNNRKPIWQWTIAHRKALEFVKLILPYLQIKRPQAELAITFQNTKKYGQLSEEQIVVQEANRILMRSYNKRGIKKNE